MRALLRARHKMLRRMLCYTVQVGLLQYTAECALAVTFLQLSQGSAESRTPEVIPPFFSVSLEQRLALLGPVAEATLGTPLLNPLIAPMHSA